MAESLDGLNATNLEANRDRPNSAKENTRSVLVDVEGSTSTV